MQCRRVRPENKHTSNIRRIEKVIFRNICVYAHAHAITISERRGHDFEGEQVGLHERI